MKLLCKEGDSRKNRMMLFLLAALVMEFLFITLESQFSYLGYYLTEDYIIVPALLFLGCGLGGQLPKFTRQRLLLAGVAIAWFTLVQIIHKLSGMDTHPIGTVFFVYLMAFPFASVSDDRTNTGLRWMGGMFLTASLVLVGYTVMLLLDLVPAAMQEYVFWDGVRLHVYWHPNISACFFMIGIGFAAAFLVQSRKTVVKVLLGTAIVIQYGAMALTNCRTSLLMTSALLGGILFLLIFKGGWKRLLVSLLVAVLVFAGSFKLSGELYSWNNSRIVAQLQAQQAEKQPETGSEQPMEMVFTEDILQGDNGQGTLANDMRTLNGRIYIWEAALKAIRDNKRLALFGTEYSGMVISAYITHSGLGERTHSHNSWMEAQLRLGLPGLLLSLAFTALSVWSAAKLVLNGSVELWKKILAMMTMCVMAAGFLEPYLFITNVYYHVTDFAFFFLTGYLDCWANREKI